MFVEERVQRKITYLWFSWESCCLSVCITRGCRFIINKILQQQQQQVPQDSSCVCKKRAIHFNLAYLYCSWSQQCKYATFPSRKNIQKVNQNKRSKHKWEVWQPPWYLPPAEVSSKEMLKFHFPFLWITLVHTYPGRTEFMERKKKFLEDFGHTMKRLFMHSGKRAKPAISRGGKSSKVWFRLDLYFIITYYGTNYT